MGLKPDLPPGVFGAYMPNAVRAVRVTSDGMAGKAVGVVESEFERRGHRIFVAAIRRGETITTASSGDVLASGDVIALAGPSEIVISEAAAREVHDPALLDIPLAQLDVVVTNPSVRGRTVEDLITGRARGWCLRRSRVARWKSRSSR